jgi:hypothetical protein
MIPTAALQKALDGGWKPSSVRRMTLAFLLVGPRSKAGETTHRPYLAMFALDPEFWQGLASAPGISTPHQEGFPWWQNTAHEFYDIVLTGGDTQKFWDELLGSHKNT